MKALLLVLIAAIRHTAASEPIQDPLDAISRTRGILVVDSASQYTFLQDGTFHQQPRGMSGRVLEGMWTEQHFRLFDTSSSPTLTRRFVVTAKQTWMNGGFRPNDYWRIIISISHGQLQPPTGGGFPCVFTGSIAIVAEHRIQSFVEQ